MTQMSPASSGHPRFDLQFATATSASSRRSPFHPAHCGFHGCRRRVFRRDRPPPPRRSGPSSMERKTAEPHRLNSSRLSGPLPLLAAGSLLVSRLYLPAAATSPSSQSATFGIRVDN